tara:strand:+ start:68 stop:3058 length:2991 start_codon:yes stop_codon:yes gene_type:complete
MADKTLAIRLQIEGSKQLTDLGRAINADEVALKKLNKRIREGKGATDLDIKAKNSLNGALKKNRNAYRDNEQAILKQNKALRKNSGFVAGVRKGVGQWATSMIGVGLAIAGVTKLVGNSVKIIKDFDQAQGNLRAVTGKTSEELSILTKQAKELGATTKFTATETTNAQVELGKLGFTIKQVSKLTPQVLQLAAATGTDLANAATIAGSTVRGFGLGAEETQRVVDVMANSFTKTSLDIDKFSTAMSIVAPVAESAGESVESTTALLGTLTDVGIDASTAGTGLRNVFLELTKKGLTFDEAMKQIQESTNKNATSLALFGKRGATVGTVLARSTEKTEELTIALQHSGGAAERMANEQLDTLEGKLTILNSAWEGFILGLDSGDGAISNLIGGFAELSTSILGALTPSKSLTDEFFDLKKETEELEKEMNPLLDRHDELAEKSELSKDEQTELKSIIVKIAEEIPTAIRGFDKYGKAIGISTDSARGFISAQRELLGLKNKEAIDENTEGFTRQRDILERLKGRYKEAADGTLRFNQQIDYGKDAIFKWIDASSEQTVEYAKQLSLINSSKRALTLQRDELLGGVLAKKLDAKATKEQALAAKLKSEIEGGGGADKRTQKEIDREKKKNEKIADDKIAATKKLQEQLDQLNIDSITNDREREEAQLRDSFTRKIESITGNSESEKELRFRLEEEMHEALNEQQAVFKEEDRAKEEEELTLKKELDLEIKTQESEEDLLKKREDLKIAREDIIADQTLTNQQKLKLLKELDQQIRDNEVKLSKFKKDTAEDVAAQAANLAGALGSLAKEGSNEAKAAAVVQAGINGALAITQALAQLGPIAGALAAVGIGITTGVQIAKISGAQFADGGVLQGASHSNGGIPFSIGGQSGFEAEGGEAIINKRSTSMFGDLLSDINEAGGGVAFARGGLARKYANGGALPNSQGVTASQQRESIQMGMGEFANQIVEGINDKEVINVSTNTTEVASEVVNTAAEATF